MTTQAAAYQDQPAAGLLVKELSHVGLTVTNIDRVIGFLCTGLGLPLLDRSPRDPTTVQHIVGVPGANTDHAYVQAPNTRIELIRYISPHDAKIVRVRPCDTGSAHVAMSVTDIDRTLKVAAQYDFTPIAEPVAVHAGPNRGNYLVYLRDPEGLTFEMIGPRNEDKLSQ